MVDGNHPLLPPKVCVTGAAGFIGSWLVKTLLQRGYHIHATVRDPGNTKKVKHLLELPKADTNLTIWKGVMEEEGSFDEAIAGCEGVFHVATPMDFDSKDPENEVIKPAINGVLNIINSCVKAKTVKRLVFTSSAGTLNVQPQQKPVYDETCWSDLDFIYAKKMTGWMYFASKILAEKEAWKVTKEKKIDFISIIPPLVVGPFITPTFPPSLITALSLITGNQAHYSIIKQGQYVHLDDLCEAHIFLYEHPKAEGRFICSSHHTTIHGLADMITQNWPEYYIPSEFKGIEKDLPVVYFSSKKLQDMGFQFKYSLEDMYRGAIETLRKKGLLPYSTKEAAAIEEEQETVALKVEKPTAIEQKQEAKTVPLKPSAIEQKQETAVPLKLEEEPTAIEQKQEVVPLKA
ncbi:PREDICTED: dihydroflavonol 4-reductase-like [Ipomoea nil]|uniref:Dihydroflavonol 4-reductase n=1 Tax=Ipomoea nil TaxID=35883 RepID=O24607_IPONI|nr:PREDICTED: dihydroflavonol 4-reductase-like [Ipomoea nil]BAA22072.1 dihydroflavonol 4-reductase [Ipomoea nil]BAA59333.1 dihydroflavonol 4-reductase [Ipomoea nil]